MMMNLLMLSDSYKYTHANQYPPDAECIYSYMESRGGRYPYTVFYGLQYILKKYMEGKVVTDQKIDQSENLINLHFGKDVFNRVGWEYIVDNYDGRLPVKVSAVKEGMIVPTHNVLMTIYNTDKKCYWLTNWLETLLLQVWYPITTATQSYHIKRLMDRFAENNGDLSGVQFKLHDFGVRGVSSMESASIGGAGHLLSFVGTDNVPALELMQEYYDSGVAGFSIPACYDAETEILTSDGFRKFSDVQMNTLVAQYTNSGDIEFVHPTDIYASPYTGNMVKFSSLGNIARVDLVVTPNHRMIRRSVETKQIEIQEAIDAKFSNNNLWIQAGNATGTVNELPMIDRLRIAFQAEGSFMDCSTWGCTSIAFTFAVGEDKKIKRLQTYLSWLGFKYREQKTDYVYSFRIDVPIEYNISKGFSWVTLDNKGAKWCNDFIEECSIWKNGTRKNNSCKYSSTIEENVDVVQAVGVLAGFRASKSKRVDKRPNRSQVYIVNLYNIPFRRGENIQKEIIPYDDFVYCVTVPTGMIVVRRHGTVSISGNTEHSTITSWGREHEVDAMKNFLEKNPEGIIACVSDSFNIYDACEKIWGSVLRDNVMNRNGTLVVRPDSGEPISIVMSCLESLGNKFGYTINEKGYKVLDKHIRIIQGDGVDEQVIEAILHAMESEMWSIDNIAFGMGGALLQKLNRDTQKFAFKCSAINRAGTWYPVKKDPITAQFKVSKSDRLKLVQVDNTIRTVKMSEYGNDLLDPVFENGRILRHQTLDDIRELLMSSQNSIGTERLK